MGIDPSDESYRELAMAGARARMHALDEERDQLLAMFPELGKRTYQRRTDPHEVIYSGPTGNGVDGEATKAKRVAPHTKRARRAHSNEFKVAAVERVRAGETIGAVAHDVDVSHSVLEKWVRGRGGIVMPTAKPAGASRSHKAKANANAFLRAVAKSAVTVGAAAASQKTSDAVARETIRIIMAHPADHITTAELQALAKIADKAASWRLQRLRIRGFAQRVTVGNRTVGYYALTPAGRAFAAESPEAPA